MADKVINTFPQGEATYSKVLGVDAQGNTVLIKTEDIALNSGNVLPTDQRLNADQKTLTAYNANNYEWGLFQKAVGGVVEDHIELTWSESGWNGIRCDKFLSWLENGENYVLSFDIKCNNTCVFMLNASSSVVPWKEISKYTTEWTRFKVSFVMSADIQRIQICHNSNATIDAGDYLHIKNISIQKKAHIDISNLKTNNFFSGKKLSIIGDSISTAAGHNAVQLKVLQSDIDNSTELKAYPTKYDIGKTFGGTEVTAEMVGSELTFTPVAADLGKEIGTPLNYGNAFDTIWWNQVANYFGMSVLANVSWSGASISSHEGNSDTYKTSYSWHPAQIAKVAQRDSNGVLQTPDVIIVYRGTNDFSHFPYAALGSYGADSTTVPVTDYSDSVYKFKDAYAILISKLRETYPKAEIFICTLNVFKRITYDHYPTRNGSYTLPQMNNAIREIANTFGVGLIEFDKDGITFENCYSEGYITDSATTPTHPNAKGHAQMAKKAVADMLAHITTL